MLYSLDMRLCSGTFQPKVALLQTLIIESRLEYPLLALPWKNYKFQDMETGVREILLQYCTLFANCTMFASCVRITYLLLIYFIIKLFKY